MRAERWVLISLACVLALLAACRTEPVPTAPRFADVTEAWGLPAGQGPAVEGTYALPEIMGSGVALFDADGDGDLDILHAVFPDPGVESGAPNRFWERTTAGFRDATRTSGLGDPGYGQAIAVGDVDGDGDLDVFNANAGPDALYLNDGAGRFEPAGSVAGVDADLWSTAATFCDYDADGDLDLYVSHYLDYAFRGRCADEAGIRDYCAPSFFDGVADRLLNNDGAGRFADVSVEQGIRGGDARGAKGLGVVCYDVNGDGRHDFLVANDGEMNHLWIQQPGGGFVNEAIQRGIAVNRHGAPEASMGIAVGDVNDDGELDVFLSHVTSETNTLYHGSAAGLFTDRSQEAGMAGRDLSFTGFGCALFDHDHDGDPDLAVANGRVYRGQVLAGADVGEFWNPFAEPNFFYDNVGGGRFVAADELAGEFVADVAVTRGLAVGDLDGDGDLDLVTSGNDRRLALYRNDAPRPGTHWLAIRLQEGTVDAVGARVTVEAGGARRTGVLLPSASYQSVHQAVVHFGLGAVDGVESIEVRWPDGGRERFAGGEADRLLTIRRGEGVVQ